MDGICDGKHLQTGARAHGFTATARFSDAALSGGAVEGPGYRALLQAARHHEFDVILAEDTSRL
jgi:hypothetical protein